MEAEELYDKVRQHPFEPLRLHISGSESYDINHPEQIMVGRRTSYVGMGKKGDGPFQRIATVSNVHVTRLEPIAHDKTD